MNPINPLFKGSSLAGGGGPEAEAPSPATLAALSALALVEKPKDITKTGPFGIKFAADERKINKSFAEFSKDELAAVSSMIEEKLKAIPGISEDKATELLAEFLSYPELNKLEGICYGLSWVFGAFLMSTDLARLEESTLLSTFEKTNLSVLATQVSFKAFFDLDNFIDEGSQKLKLENLSIDSFDVRKEPVVSEFISRALGTRFAISSPYSERAHLIEEKLVPFKAIIKKLAAEVDYDAIEDTDEHAEALTKKQEAGDDLKEEDSKFLELYKAAKASEPFVLELNELQSELCIFPHELFPKLRKVGAENNKCALVLRLQLEDDEEALNSGHATCCYIDQDSSKFIYFDPNLGVYCFSTLSDLAKYTAWSIGKNYNLDKLSYSIISKA